VGRITRCPAAHSATPPPTTVVHPLTPPPPPVPCIPVPCCCSHQNGTVEVRNFTLADFGVACAAKGEGAQQGVITSMLALPLPEGIFVSSDSTGHVVTWKLTL
jgi:hypothetical protein